MKGCCDFNILHSSKYQNLNNLEAKQNRRLKNAPTTKYFPHREIREVLCF